MHGSCYKSDFVLPLSGRCLSKPHLSWRQWQLNLASPQLVPSSSNSALCFALSSSPSVPHLGPRSQKVHSRERRFFFAGVPLPLISQLFCQDIKWLQVIPTSNPSLDPGVCLLELLVRERSYFPEAAETPLLSCQPISLTHLVCAPISWAEVRFCPL